MNFGLHEAAHLILKLDAYTFSTFIVFEISNRQQFTGRSVKQTNDTQLATMTNIYFLNHHFRPSTGKKPVHLRERCREWTVAAGFRLIDPSRLSGPECSGRDDSQAQEAEAEVSKAKTVCRSRFIHV